MQISLVRFIRLAESWRDAKRRYERKFLLDRGEERRAESMLRFHQARFVEIYHRRWVNNIYLDTRQLESYSDNVSGFSEHRVKVRIRWYGELFGEIEKPTLELKVKRGWLNWKFSFPLPPFRLDESFGVEELDDVIRAAELAAPLRLELRRLVPALLNRYSRKYFRSGNRTFRVTIDSDLSYHRIDEVGRARLWHAWSPGVGVLELKYAEAEDGGAHRITQGLPYRLSRSSKYVSGMDLTREVPAGDFWKTASQRLGRRAM